MHASMMNAGEEGVDAREVFTDLGVLIVEGRMPGGQYASGRGYGEGPHCPKPTPAAVLPRHECDNSFLCQRAENLRKHLQLLWENNVPLCVEVLLCPDCSCGAQKASCSDVANVPSPGDMLLEQWLVTMVPITKRCPDPVLMTVRGLFQAVRSQLHFSQLCAWWSSSKGSNPANVNYRVTVPGEAFASQFRSQPQLHSFPIATVSKATCIKVSVRTVPRMEFVPKVLCSVHHKSEAGAVGGEEPVNHSAKLLGESLVEPPQNVDHFPKKCQSSSRSTSPAADTSDHSVFTRCRRDGSPPSPPMSLQHPRRGRQGLARRRDVSLMENIPGMVDDRMQNPCTRPGKHHCRCAFEEEIEPLPCTTRRKPVTSPAKDYQAQLSLSPKPSRVNDSLCSSKTQVNDNTPKSKSNFEQEAFGKGIELPQCPNVDKAPFRYRSKSPTFSKQSCSKLCSEAKRDPNVVCPEKQAKRVRKEEHCDAKAGAGGKLNLELSQREFEEVLSVLRDRNGPSSHHGSKSHSYSSGNAQGLKCQPDSTSRHSWNTVVCNVQTPLQTKASTSGKADRFMEAILRTSDNNSMKTKANSPDSLGTKSMSEEVSALSRQLSKISLGVDKKPCSAVDSDSASSGAKRKRFDFKFDVDKESVRHCDSVSNKRPSDPLFVFDDNLPSNNFITSLTSQGKFTAKSNQNDFDCLSSTIDERPLTSISRTNKLVKRRCDLTVQVPCDANDGKNVVSKSSFTVIKDGDSYPPQISNPKGPRTRIEASKSDIIVPLQSTETNKLNGDISNKTSGPSKDFNESKEANREVCKTHQVDESQDNRPVPSASEKAKFRRNLDTAASLVFHSRTGLPLTSSPAPIRRNATCFDFDSSINCVSAIRSALFESATPAPSDDNLSFSSDDAESEGRSPCSPKISLPPVRCCWSHYPHLASSLLGTFEESVLNGRLEPVSTVQGFTANLGASGSFCPRHVTLPITVFFYTLGDNDKVSTPYLAHINLGKKGYNVPRCGTIQVTLFNPMGTVVKMFVVMYDLTDMPPNSHTFLRQRTLYMPANTDSSCQPDDFQKWLRYLIHLRFTSSKSGRIYLHTDIRMIIFRKSDLDTATAHGVDDVAYELRSFTQGPTNPKFSSRK